MAVRQETRELPALSLRAAVVPDSINVDKRTVDLVWTTGARVMRGFFERYWEELSTSPKHVRMDRLKSGSAPLLNTHDGFDVRGVLGVVVKASLKGGEGRATVRFARAEDDPEADQIFRKVADKIIRNVSIGYRVYRLEKVEEDADKIPVYQATDWEPHEISLVPMGADAGAGVRSAGVETNPCKFVTGQQERSMDPEQEETKPTTTGAAPASAPPAAEKLSPAIDADAVRREGAESERKRIADIQRVGRSLSLPGDFVARHVNEGTSVDAFRGMAIDEYERARPPIVEDAGRVSAVPGGDERDKWLRGAGDWIMQRAAVGGVIERAAAARGEDVRIDPGEFRGMTLLDLARSALERDGVRTAGMSKMELVGRAFTHRGGGYAATGDFPVLLENVMHKTLLAFFANTPDTWSRFCGVGSVSDFRAHNRYRLGSFASLDTVAEHGEYKNKSIPDGEKQTISATTKGNIIGITRQAMINDDMDAFNSLPMMLGRAAALTIENAVYALLAENSGLGPNMSDGKTLFHADHKNVGASAALSVDAIDSDRVVLASQQDPSGNEILELRPKVLLVPVGLGGNARVINDAQYDPDTASKLQKPNKVRGLFADVVDTARLTGTRRYMFADPMDARTIEVAFLDGQREPVMELQEGWRVDGVEYKVRLDFGVAAVEYRGAVTNAGA